MDFVNAHGARMPAIGFGTFPMRGETCVKAVAAALDCGYRHIDTAAGYNNEPEVGEAVRASGVPRDDIFITTKIRPEDLAEGDMQRAVEQSLKALGIDVVDLVLIHWPSQTIPVVKTVRSLNDVHRRGLARHIGISNFNVKLVAQAWAATAVPLACNQCEYHPYLDQKALLDACRVRGMAFTAYAPVGWGHELTDPAVVAIAEAVGRTPAQVVLRWLIQQPGVVAIPKSASSDRIRENLDVFGFRLDDTQMSAVSALARPSSRLIGSPVHDPDWEV
jgi:diketogulonate reductase-like aldo/keto reductase